MARINLEDELFKDGRFTKLCILQGSRRLALGSIIEAWMLAQLYVSPENPSAKIPLSDWNDQDMAPEIISVKLAKIIDDNFVEVSGAKEHFAWLVQKQLAAKKGGFAKAKQKNEAHLEVPESAGAVPESAGAVPEQPETCPLTLTLTPSLTLSSFSNSNSNSLNIDPKPKRKRKVASAPTEPKEPSKASNFIARYCENFSIKHDISYNPSGKQIGLMKSMAERLKLEEIDTFVDAYFCFPDPMVYKSKHPVETMNFKFNEILVFAKSGKFTSMIEARNLEKQHNISTLSQSVQNGKNF